MEITSLILIAFFVKYNSFQYCKLAFTNFTPPYDQSPYFAAVFDIVNGLVTTTNSVGNPTNTNSSIVDYGNGWFRISISAALSPSSGSFNFEFNKSPNATPTFENFGRINQTTTTDDKVYVYGGQLEQLPYATSYIPTAGSTATRLGETAINAGDVNVFNSEEGVLYAELSTNFEASGGVKAVSVQYDVNNYVAIYFRNDNNLSARVVGSGNVTQVDTTYAINTFYKIAVSYNSTNVKFYVNGTQVDIDTTNTLPNSLNKVSFNRGSTSSLTEMEGKVRNVQVFNKH